MKYSQTLDILSLITAYDRAEFPPEAAQAWHLALSDIDFEDARNAVVKHYTVLGSRDHNGAVKRMIPSDVRNTATGFRQARERAERRALEASAEAEVRGVAARSAATSALLRASLRKAAADAANFRARDREPVAL